MLKNGLFLAIALDRLHKEIDTIVYFGIADRELAPPKPNNDEYIIFYFMKKIIPIFYEENYSIPNIINVLIKGILLNKNKLMKTRRLTRHTYKSDGPNDT